MMLWLQFAVCALVITFAGSKLSKYGDIIAHVTGLGRTFVGVLLLASATSLPELITGTTAVAMHDAPDIAAGDVLGSCMVNLMIIAVLDILNRDRQLLAAGDRDHVLSCAWGIGLLAVVTVSLLARDRVPAIGWIGIYTPVLLLGYVLAMKMLFTLSQQSESEGQEEKEGAAMSRGRAFAMFGLNAAIVIAAASWLPSIGKQIAEQTGFEQSFVGTLFIALSTSLPEFVVTFAAMRQGAVNLALGNVFGSNLFNLAVLAIEDVAYTKAPLLSVVSSSHGVTASMAILMTAIAVVGLSRVRGRPRAGIGWAAISLAAVFAVGLVISYRMGASQT